MKVTFRRALTQIGGAGQRRAMTVPGQKRRLSPQHLIMRNARNISMRERNRRKKVKKQRGSETRRIRTGVVVFCHDKPNT